MGNVDSYAEVADRFATVARQYCSVVESAATLDRTELLLRIYRILPKLIDEAISLPQVDTSDDDQTVEEMPRVSVRQSGDEWSHLYNLLKEKLGDWDLYWQVFDPITDREAICGTLADDIADIYRDLRRGLVLHELPSCPSADVIWDWRLHYYFHWGQHAIEALFTIHERLRGSLE